MGRSTCCSKDGLNKGAWTAMEDKILTDYIQIHGEGKWRNLPKKAGLKRGGKSCRLRWLNYLSPGIKRGNITNDEEELIIRLHKLLGNRWSLIAGRLPGRTDNEIKNYWNTVIGKKIQNQQNPSITFNQADKEKPNHTIQKYKSQEPYHNVTNGNATVVWTTASRFSNVVIMPPDSPNNVDNNQQQLDTKPMISATLDTPVDNKPWPEIESLVLPFNTEENDSSNLIVDFEMDDQMLSELLNTDFSQLTNFNNGTVSDTSISEQGHLSPNSNQTLLFSDDALRDSDFPPIDLLIDAELDWLV